ncbi:MAG: ATP-binding protein [Burkholderiaceae bacterium]|jgi:signal transduction histidine kinase/ActR/RegA family two-component response regulator|nr:response regulator [Burkholderiales bacterium]MCZ8103118.1 ATP-binding protein [Burkholderiales bacterium]MCZ8338053.1 ATP-binding protein [Burkholderiaceae bacterium]
MAADAPAGPVTAAPIGPPSAAQALLDTVARQSRLIVIPVSMTSLLIVSATRDKIAMPFLLAWLAGTIGIQLFRAWSMPRLAADTSRPDAERLAYASRISLFNGCLQASSVLAFPWLDLTERALVTMILVGLTSGVVVSGKLFRAFSAPILGLLAIQWSLVSSPELADWSRWGVSGLLVLLYLLLQRLATDTGAAMAETFAIRSREVSLRRDLQDLNERLKVALEQAQAANRAKTRFLASASHDLRQPLHALLLFTAALSMRRLDPKSQEIAARIDDATQALAYELDTLLDVSKLDAGIVRVSRETLDPSAVAARLVETMAPLAQRKGVSLTLSAQPGLLVDTDRTLIERVLRNLLDNAIKYTDRGSIAFEARREGPWVALAVVDTGRGIPPSEHDRIFEEFYQVDNPERDRQRGLGLGLAIVRRLVGLLGGELRVESELGHGSTFTLRLPAAPDPAPVPEPALAAHRRTLDGLRVLVVDDEASVRLGTSLLLEGMGCQVSVARGTDEAVEVAAHAAPDIVLADLRLRGEDSGVRAVAALRALRPGLPALLISGDTAPDRLREAERACLTLLHKPVPAEALAKAIGDALAGGDAIGKG